MAKSILLRITGDRTDAKATVDAEVAQLRDFGKSKYTAAVRVDAAQAKADLAEVIAQAKAVPREEVIRIRVAGEQAKLDQLTTRLQGLEKALASAASGGNATDPIIARMGGVARQIDTTRAHIEALGHDFDNLGQDASRDFEKVSSGIGDVAGRVPLIGGLLKGAVSAVSGALSGVASLLPEAAQGFAGVVSAGLGLAAVGPIVLAIAAAMAALVVSLGMALIGIAALGVAFLAALGPIALLVGAIVLKVKSLTAAQTAQTQAIKDLHAAQVQESTQRLSALQAERDATLALADANNGVADAKLGVQSATLAIQQAKQALAAFKQTAAGSALTAAGLDSKAGNVDVAGALGQTQATGGPSSQRSSLLQYEQLVLAVKQAEQQRRDAVQGVADATNNQSKAQQTANGYAKNGIAAYQPYADAVKAASTATASLHAAQAKLAGGGGGFLKTLDHLKHTLSTLFDAPVAAAFKGIGKGLDILASGLKPLEPSLVLLGKAFGGAFVQFARDITDPATEKAITGLIRNSAKLVGPLVKLFDHFMTVLLIVANAAMPTLLGLVDKLGAKFGDAAKHPKKIRDFIIQCLDQTRTWWHAIEDVVGVFKKLADTLGPIEKIFNAITSPIRAAAQFAGDIAGGETLQEAQSNAAGANDEQSLIAKDEKLLKGGHLSTQMRKFLREQLHNFGVKGYADGGVATGPTLGMFGEAGDEAILPLSGRGADLVARAIAGRMAEYFAQSAKAPAAAGASPAAGGGFTQHNHFGSGAPTDPDHFAAVTARRMRGLGGGIRG